MAKTAVWGVLYAIGFQCFKIFDQTHEVLVLIAKASNGGSVEPPQMSSLLGAFAVGISIVWKQMKTQAKK